MSGPSLVANNQGASFVILGEFEQALVCFTRALDWIMYTNHNEDGSSEECTDQECMSLVLSFPHYERLPAKPALSCSYERTNGDSVTPLAEPAQSLLLKYDVWKDPFLIPQNVADGYWQEELWYVATACAIFNTGLAYQLQGTRRLHNNVTTSDISSAMLDIQCAILFYQQTLHVLQEISDVETSIMATMRWIIFKIAILNNLGICYARTGANDNSRRHFQELYTMLASILYGRVTAQSAPAAATNQAEADLLHIAKRFLRNAQLGESQSPQECFAAAA